MPPARKPTPPVTTDTAALADHRTRLEALRDRLTAALDSATDRNLAPIARQLQHVLDGLAQLPSDGPPDAVALLAAKRSARLAGLPEAPRRTARVPKNS
jgi:hypothetical protein